MRLTVCSPTSTDPGSYYMVRSVMLHENGHVAGLDHVNQSSEIMYPYYQGPRCTRGQGDQAGVIPRA